MRHETSQSQKDKHCMIPLIQAPGAVRFIKAERRKVIARGWESGELLFTEYSLGCFRSDDDLKKRLETDGAKIA